MKSQVLPITLAALVLVLAFGLPASPWEFDEFLFFQALHGYDPLAHHPPPPGYPVFILAGQLARTLIPSDFWALVVISTSASIAAFLLLALAFRNLAGDEAAGVAGAWLFYLSPAMLIHATLPISDPGAVALLAGALYFWSRTQATLPLTRPPATLSPLAWGERTRDHATGEHPRRAEALLFALFAALSVGWRIQFAIFIVPFFLLGTAMLRRWRERLAALAVFTVVCLLWLVPLASAVGGVRELIDFELGQGKYLAAHDAAESRTGWTPARLAFRFIGRAWGNEAMALSILSLAAGGLVVLVRRRLRTLLPLFAGAGLYIAFALLVMDPADGVRYSIPFLLATSLCAGAGVVALARRFRWPAWILPAAAAAAFLAYTGPLLLQRRLTVSPPVRAAHWASTSQPANAVALYELPLWPHATYLLAGRSPMPVDAGLAKFWDRPDVPLFVYADGATSAPGARVFRWRPSDAYLKLTRDHYRAASIIPVPPQARFRIVRGIHGPERSQDGLEWRWMDSVAELQLPPGPERALHLRVGLPDAAPLEENVVRVSIEGRPATVIYVNRGMPSVATVRVPAGSPLVRLDSERSFIPAEVPAMRSGDRRRLAVELHEVRTAAFADGLPPSSR